MNLHTVAHTIGIPVDRWPGRCHEIAAACLKAKVVTGRLCYGHFLGTIAKTGRFAGRRFAHHGWIELKDGRAWDPTRWVFEDVAPYIYIGPADDYDFGGNRLNEIFRRPFPPQVGDTILLALPKRTRRIIGAVIGNLTWDGRLTPDQLHWIANINIERLGLGHTRALYRELMRIGWGAHIPIDNRTYILRR